MSISLEPIKHVTDVAAVGVLGGTWANLLPDVAALFTIVWLAIRMWESETVRKWVGRK